jgi:hypothetical protein
MEYEKQAQEFLTKYNLTLKAAFKGDKRPPWDDNKHIHGDRYRVTIKRQDRKSISFDFWNSFNDSQNSKRPTSYDVLACISSDAYMPTTPDEVVEELGDMKPSQAIATAKLAKKLQSFFTESELTDLAEIQ